MQKSYRCRAASRWNSDASLNVQAEGVCVPIQVAATQESGVQISHWTPEHLFVASVVSSYAATFRELARLAGLNYAALEVEAEGMVEATESGVHFTQVVLHPSLALLKESDRKRALRLLGTAALRSIISQSIRTTVRLEHVVTVSATAA